MFVRAPVFSASEPEKPRGDEGKGHGDPQGSVMENVATTMHFNLP